MIQECKMRKVQLAELDSIYDSLDLELIEEKSVRRTQDKVNNSISTIIN
jgi:hypothetical protein